MSSRKVVEISNDPARARLEIIAHLAYPARPTFGLAIVEQWSAHHARMPSRSREKWSRLEPKLRRLDDLVRRRLKGAYWLRLWGNQQIDPSGHALGIRASARLVASRISSAPKVENIIRDYWTQTREVAHLGLATGEAIHRALQLGAPFDLRRAAFELDWSERALRQAEIYARSADELGVIPLAQATHFKLGTFFEDS